MQWWNDFVDWFNSDDGWRVISTAVIPFVAIVVAGIIGALVGRGATRRLISWQDRELQSAAVAAMISVGDRASMWSSLPAGEKDHLDAQMSAADIRLRLLPLTGSSAAADWASHELSSMQRDSANFSFQAEQSFIDYRDRLLEWQRRPGRARKLFAADLERFRLESSEAETELVEKQRQWAAEQLAEATKEAPPTASVPVVAPTVDQAQFAPVVAPEPIVPEPIVPERTLADSAATDRVVAERAEAQRAETQRAEAQRAETQRAETQRAETQRAETQRAAIVVEPIAAAEPVAAVEPGVQASAPEPVSVPRPVEAEPARPFALSEPAAFQSAASAASVESPSAMSPAVVESAPEAPARPPLVVSTPAPLTPASPAQAESVPAESVPAEPVQSESVQSESVQSESVQSESVPAESVPAESVPAESVPAESVPAESVQSPASAASVPSAESVQSPAEAPTAERPSTPSTFDPQETQPYTGPIPTLATRTGSIPVQDDRS